MEDKAEIKGKRGSGGLRLREGRGGGGGGSQSRGQRQANRPCNTISGLAGGAARWELKCKFEVRNCGGAISSLGRKLAR